MSRPFDGETLRLAISATFERRQTPLPSDPPLALTTAFAADPQKGRQWDAFVGRIRGAEHPDLSEVIDTLRAFLWPALLAAATNVPWQRRWCPAAHGATPDLAHDTPRSRQIRTGFSPWHPSSMWEDLQLALLIEFG